MCLYFHKKETEKLTARLKRNKKVTFYKELELSVETSSKYNSGTYTVTIGEINGTVSPFRGSRTVLKNGYLVSNRKSKHILTREYCSGINRGIHVYRYKPKCHGLLVFSVPVTGCLSNFVAAGESIRGKPNEAVFTKIKIDKEILKKQIISLIKKNIKTYRCVLSKKTMEKGVLLFHVIERGKKKDIREDIKTFKLDCKSKETE